MFCYWRRKSRGFPFSNKIAVKLISGQAPDNRSESEHAYQWGVKTKGRILPESCRTERQSDVLAKERFDVARASHQHQRNQSQPHADAPVAAQFIFKG